MERYPFVAKGEAKSRPLDGQAREKFDKMVDERVHNPKAEVALRLRISEEFPNGSGKLLTQMLDFDLTKRPSAVECRRMGTLWLRLQMEYVRSGRPTGSFITDGILVLHPLSSSNNTAIKGKAMLNKIATPRSMS